MTIHQSKGLGFDVVILPDLQGRGITEAGEIDFAIARERGQPVWALKMPRRLISQSDPVLNEQLQAEDETACFDALCVHYVALTRAKRALYMVTGYPGKTASAMTPATLLKTQLTGDPKPKEGTHTTIDGEEAVCLYESGKRDWYLNVPIIEQPEEPAKVPLLSKEFADLPSQRQRLIRVSPSTQAKHEMNAGSLFERSYRESLDFGTAIHELFAGVSWIEETDIDNLIAKWHQQSSATDDFKQRVISGFHRAIESDEIRRALSRPEGNIDLWREKRFEIVLDDKWVTGSFDRVVIKRDTGGKLLKATVIDFKSDEVASEAEPISTAERYWPQLSLYAKALARMLGLEASQITCQLLFTDSGVIIDLKSE